MGRYKVAEGTQVNVGGVVHADGATFDAEPAQVASSVRVGDVVPVDKPTKAAPKPSRRTAG